MADDGSLSGAGDFAPFVAQGPWWGGDLQTVRNTLRRRVPSLADHPGERLAFRMPDGTGDVLLGSLHQARSEGNRPLAILLHGLTGCEGSTYLLRTAAFLLDTGYHVLRLNLRGAGPSRAQCRFQYHAGRTDDFRAVLAALPDELVGSGVVAIGYSLGGNMLLKYLGEAGEETPLAAAVSVSAPIDLAATAHRFHAFRNRVYLRWLLARMKAEATAPIAALTDRERRAIAAARTVIAFDDTFVAPHNGFADAANYYAECSALRFLGGIARPTLMIHALNDPWIPGEAYLRFDWGANPWLHPLLSRGGGHVGFHARGDRVAWHDRCAAAFLARFASPTCSP